MTFAGKHVWTPQGLRCVPWEYATPTTCRVCSRTIEKGDYAWSWVWDEPFDGRSAVQYGCAACGWYRLEDFPVDVLRSIADAAAGLARRSALRILADRYHLVTLGKANFSWTLAGEPLRDRMRKVAEEKEKKSCE